jgi:tetratricopeptide (TPR) repeat protein
MIRAVKAGGPHGVNSAWCLTELARMALHRHDLSRAEEWAGRALAAAPLNPRALNTMADVQTMKGDYPAALKLFDKSVETTPTHEALAGRVELHRLMGRHREAEVDFRKVLDFHGADGHSHAPGEHAHTHEGNSQLARFLADEERLLSQALAEARAEYQRFPNIHAGDALAWALLKSGKSNEAREIIEQVLRWKTPDPEIHFHAGMIYHSEGETALARRHVARALELNPQFHPRYCLVAQRLLASLP